MQIKFEFSCSTFSTSKQFSYPVFLKILLQTGSKLRPASCLEAFQLVKFDITLKGDLLAVFIYGMMVPMDPCGFTTVRLSILLPKHPLWTSVTLFKLLRGKSWSLCHHPVSWLEWSMVGWIYGSFRRAPWLLKGCVIPTKNSSDSIVSIGNKNCSIQAMLVWDSFYVIRFLGGYYPRRVASSCRLSTWDEFMVTLTSVGVFSR